MFSVKFKAESSILIFLYCREVAIANAPFIAALCSHPLFGLHKIGGITFRAVLVFVKEEQIGNVLINYLFQISRSHKLYQQ